MKHLKLETRIQKLWSLNYYSFFLLSFLFISSLSLSGQSGTCCVPDGQFEKLINKNKLKNFLSRNQGNCKEVLVNFHIMQRANGQGTFEATEEELDYIAGILWQLNENSFQNPDLLETCSDNCTTTPDSYQFDTPQGETGIKLILNKIKFHNDDDAAVNNYGVRLSPSDRGLYNNYIAPNDLYDDALNVFFTEGAPCGGSGLPNYCGIGNPSAASPYVILNNVFTEEYPQRNRPSQGPWDPAGLLGHEIGHALGLQHVWEDSNNNHECQGECWAFWENQWQWAPKTTQWNGGSNTMMGYGGTKRFITENEIAIMNMNLTTGHQADFVDPTPCAEQVYDRDHTIEVNEVEIYCGDVRVSNGSTLTIQGTLLMRPGTSAPYSKITVDRGCTLIIDGGLIDISYSGGTWAGIVMETNSNVRVEVINGGKIRRARNAISKTEYGDVAKGQIIVNDGTFERCNRAIAIANANGGVPVIENSSFTRANFLTCYSDAAVSLYQAANITFEGCTFNGRSRSTFGNPRTRWDMERALYINQSENIDIRGTVFSNISDLGVDVKRSQIRLIGSQFVADQRGVNQGVLIRECDGREGSRIGDYEDAGNNFDVQGAAIVVEASQTTSQTYISGNTIFNARTGIFVNGNSNININYNRIGMEGSQTIESGILINNSGLKSEPEHRKWIRRNVISEVLSAIECRGDNRDLKILDNCFSSENVDIFVSGLGINPIQRNDLHWTSSLDETAGNCFTNNGVTAIDYQVQNRLTYYQSDLNNSCLNPELITANVDLMDGQVINPVNCFGRQSPIDDDCETASSTEVGLNLICGNSIDLDTYFTATNRGSYYNTACYNTGTCPTGQSLGSIVPITSSGQFTFSKCIESVGECPSSCDDFNIVLTNCDLSSSATFDNVSGDPCNANSTVCLEIFLGPNCGLTAPFNYQGSTFSNNLGIALAYADLTPNASNEIEVCFDSDDLAAQSGNTFNLVANLVLGYSGAAGTCSTTINTSYNIPSCVECDCEVEIDDNGDCTLDVVVFGSGCENYTLEVLKYANPDCSGTSCNLLELSNLPTHGDTYVITDLEVGDCADFYNDTGYQAKLIGNNGCTNDVDSCVELYDCVCDEEIVPDGNEYGLVYFQECTGSSLKFIWNASYGLTCPDCCTPSGTYDITAQLFKNGVPLSSSSSTNDFAAYGSCGFGHGNPFSLHCSTVNVGDVISVEFTVDDIDIEGCLEDLPNTITWSGTSHTISSSDMYCCGALPSNDNQGNRLQLSANTELDEASEYKLMPNPATENVAIYNNGNKEYSMSMHNLTGQQVLAVSDIKLNNYEIDLSTLPSGLYLVTIITDGKREVKKLVIE